MTQQLERFVRISMAQGLSEFSKDLSKVVERHEGKAPKTLKGLTLYENRYSNPRVKPAVEAEKKPLMPNERRLVSVLKEKPNEVISEVELHDRIYGQKNSQGSIKKLVSRTRAKIEDDPKKPKKIVTEYGEGYFWRDKRYFNSELIFDPDSFLLTVSDIGINLGEIQGEIFGILVENAGDVVTHETFSEQLWGLQNERALLVNYISKIRRRVFAVTHTKLKSIVSVPEVGYKLVDPGRIENSPVAVFERTLSA